MNTLAIDSSMLEEYSISKLLMQRLLQHNKNDIIYRDLVKDNPAHLDLRITWNNVTNDDTDENLAYQINLSKIYLEEFIAAKKVIIAAPMYNFSVPSVLKAWIDRIMVAGKTFKYTEQGPLGLLNDKEVFIISSRGGEYERLPELHSMDYQERYLKTVFNFIGINNITVIRAEGVNMGEHKKNEAITSAYSQIDALAKRFKSEVTSAI